MDSEELRNRLVALGVPEEGITYILSAARERPNVLLSSGPKGNLTGDLATSMRTYLDDCVDGPVESRVQVQSMSAEFAYVVVLEARGDVVLLLNHPSPVFLTIKNKAGRRQRISYTPDFLVVSHDRVWVAELKTDDGARELVEKNPHEWSENEGAFVYRAAKEHFSSMGIEHQVEVSSNLPWSLTQNRLFLLRAMARKPVEEDVLDASRRDESIVRHVGRHYPCSIRDLVRKLGLANADPVLWLLFQGKISADLSRVNLTSPECRYLCPSDDLAKNVALGLATVDRLARSESGVSVEGVGAPSDLAEIGYRMAVVRGATPENRPDNKKPPSERTIRRWKRDFRKHGPGGIIPNWQRCGTTGPRIEEWHDKLLKKQIAEERGSDTYTTRAKAHGRYKDQLQEENKRQSHPETPICYSHYCRLWARRKHDPTDALNRGGKRLANALAPHSDVDIRFPLANGPFQVAHIDHCYLPTSAKSSKTDDSYEEGQPFLTLLVDDWESEPLAIHISLEPPSAETDLAVMRDCLRRHGRLPYAVISDHGSDFMGNVFVGCLAAMGMHHFNRPEASGRHGAPVERSFLTVANIVCRGYDGFRPDIFNLRSISRKKLPSNGRRRELLELQQHIEHLVFEVIPNLPSLEDGLSKLEKRLQFEQVYGKQGNEHAYDLRFLVSTAPPIKERGSWEPSGAIRVFGTRFYSPGLVGAVPSKKSPILRREPENPTIIYFYHDKFWRVARSSNSRQFQNVDDKVAAIDAAIQAGQDKSAVKQARKDMLHSSRAAPKRSANEQVDDSNEGSQRSVGKSTKGNRKRPRPAKPLPNLPRPFADAQTKDAG